MIHLISRSVETNTVFLDIEVIHRHRSFDFTKLTCMLNSATTDGAETIRPIYQFGPRRLGPLPIRPIADSAHCRISGARVK